MARNVQTQLKEGLANVSAASGVRRGTVFEVEARFGYHSTSKYGNVYFRSEVRRPMWFRFKSSLIEMKLKSQRLNIATNSWPDPRDKFTTIRRRTIDGKTSWDEKTPFGDPIDDVENWTRYAISEEKSIRPQNRPKTYDTRSGVRYVFEWDAITRIEMSEIGNEGNLTLEIEVELVNPGKNGHRLSDWWANVEKIRNLYLGTRLRYTRTDLTDINSLVNSMLKPDEAGDFIDRRVMSTARNLYRYDLRAGPGGLMGPGSARRYTITYKTMGHRRLLVIGPKGIWVIFSPYEYNKISNKNFSRFTALDVEQLPSDDYLFEIIDALYVGGRDIRELSFIERLAQASDYMSAGYEKGFFDVSVIGTTIVMNSKDVKHFDTPEQMFAIIDHIYTSKRRSFQLSRVNPDLVHIFKIDGIIITPDGPYVDGFRKDAGAILKWKPSNYQTIDLRVIRSRSGDYDLYYAVKNPEYQPGSKAPKLLNEKFVGAPGLPFDSATMLDISDTALLDNNYAVIEFKWRQGKLVPYLPRNEKDGPNNKGVTMDNWRDINHPITLDDMSGRTLAFYKIYHNAVKVELLESVLTGFGKDTNRVLLDLGSGQGGDLKKWRDFSMVIAVEPNFDNDPARFPEFRKRLHKIYPDGTGPEIILIRAAGQDHHIIVPWVNYLTKGQGVDAVSMMDSLTFFWESSNDLEQLAQTIKSCLKQGGQFIWKVMNGELAYDLFRPPFGQSPDTDILVFGDPSTEQISIQLIDEPQGKVEVIIPGFVNRQIEYLSRISDLIHMLAPDLELEWQKRASDPTYFLTSDLLKFSSLYSYGLFTRKSPLQQIQSDPPDMSRRVDLSQIKVGQVGDLEIPPEPEVQRSTVYIPRLTRVDSHEAIPSWFETDLKLERLYVIDDGHCMIHAFLSAVYPPYQLGKDYTPEQDLVYKGVTYPAGKVIQNQNLVRTLIAVRFRHDLSLYLRANAETDQPAPDLGLPFVNWEMINNSDLVSKHLTQMITSGNQIADEEPADNGGRQDYSIDYSLLGIYLLLNSSAYLGDETFNILTDATGIDVALVDNADGQTRFVHYFSKDLTAKNPCCVLLGGAGHYETVGVLGENGLLETIFYPGHPVYEDLHSRVEVTPKIGFYQAIASTLRELGSSIKPETWIIYNSMIVRPVQGDGRNISFGYNPLYHHLWLISVAIARGVYPGDIISDAVEESPAVSHMRMTVQAITEQGLDEEGRLNDRGREILDINGEFIGKMRSGASAMTLKNRQKLYLVYKELAIAALKKNLGV